MSRDWWPEEGRWPGDRLGEAFRRGASGKGEIRVIRQDPAESEAAFERLLKARADHAAGMNYLGYMWADRGENLPRALELIRKAVDLEPTNGAYLDSLGWVYFRLNKLDKAEENLVVAASLNPDDATVEEHLGDLWEREKRLKFLDSIPFFLLQSPQSFPTPLRL